MRQNKKQEAEIRNQRICEQLVRREVITCVSLLVYEMGKHGEDNPMFGRESDYSYDEFLDLCRNADWEQPACDEIRDWDADQCNKYLDQRDEAECSSRGELPYVDKEGTPVKTVARKRYGLKRLREMCLEAAESQGWQEFCEEHQLEAHENEVYEHWVVTPWFKARLAEQGETVGDLFGLDIWGRCATGQSISMDGVIRSIASSMEILVGQKNEWKE